MIDKDAVEIRFAIEIRLAAPRNVPKRTGPAAVALSARPPWQEVAVPGARQNLDADLAGGVTSVSKRIQRPRYPTARFGR